jgi:AhpC/TSA family
MSENAYLFKGLTMKAFFTLLILIGHALALETGAQAPDFTLKSASGSEIKLSDYKGKIVVLEWLNHGCPFVKKHYSSGNMQALQKTYTGKNVIWFSVISSAPGKQGHVDAAGALKDKQDKKSQATDILLDPSGEVGKLYDAKTTPHMFVVDKSGALAYQGAIDSVADTEPGSIASAKNYVALGLDALISGKKVAQEKTQSYGCSVKY